VDRKALQAKLQREKAKQHLIDFVANITLNKLKVAKLQII
jgi:hypothetical protein